jgi:hypothetical protein
MKEDLAVGPDRLHQAGVIRVAGLNAANSSGAFDNIAAVGEQVPVLNGTQGLAENVDRDENRISLRPLTNTASARDRAQWA